MTAPAGSSRAGVTSSTVSAALLHSIAGSHALGDGNKRLGWLAVVVFLDLNDAEPLVGDEQAFALVMDVAAGDMSVDEIARRLRVARRADLS